jgi:hypothetical protein
VKIRGVAHVLIGSLIASVIVAIGPSTPAANAVYNCAQGGTCAEGDIGPSGGRVFYVATSTFTSTGSACGAQCKYLEWAPQGWATAPSLVALNVSTNPTIGIAGNLGTLTTDPLMYWASDIYNNRAAGTTDGIGTGFANTQKMLSANVGTGYFADTEGTAAFANTYAGGTSAVAGNGTAGNWFVPSKAEALEMYRYWNSNGKTIGGFTLGYYHSSSEVNGSISYFYSMSNGSTTNNAGKSAFREYFRPIRAFSQMAAPTMTLSRNSETVNAGTAISGYTVTSTGSPTYSISPDISVTPANGISFNTTTGLVSGTPSAGAAAVTYTITATNAGGFVTATYSLTANAAPVATTNNQAEREADAARKAKEQKELMEILALIPSIGQLTLSLGETTQSLYSTKCVKGKTTKYVKYGAKCPKGYVKKK